MNAKNYLERAHRIVAQIDSKYEILEMLRAKAMKTTGRISDVVAQRSAASRTMANAVDALADLEKTIQNDCDELCKTYREVMNVIDGLDDIDSRLILTKRYLLDKPFADIAEEMGLSTSSIFRLHDQGLERLNVPETA